MELQGHNANVAGKSLEKRVERLFEFLDISVIPYSEFDFNADSEWVLLTQVPYVTIYGGMGRGDFLLVRDTNFKNGIRIECRSQHRAGSVDEKLPYLFESAVAFEQRDVIIILEGSGFKFGAKEWLKYRSETVRFKNIKVYSFNEFCGFVLKLFNLSPEILEDKSFKFFQAV